MATASGRAPVGLRNVGRDPSGFAVLNVFDLVVASVRDLAVDLLFGDQVVLGVDSDLDVLAHSDPCPGMH